MNKYEYLAQLRAGLSPLSLEEREAAMSYYEEFFSDAGEENEQAVIASLGSPEQLAKSIIDENKGDSAEETATSSAEAPAESASGFTPPPTNGQQAKKWIGGQLALLIVLLVLASPAIIGITCGGFGATIGLIAGFGGAAIGVFVGGIVTFGEGVGLLFSEPVYGVMYMGVGLICAGLGPLVFYPLCKLMVKLFKVCIKGIKTLVNKIAGKGGVEA